MNPTMVKIRELAGRVGTLNAGELASLTQLVATHFKELDTDGATVDDTAVLVELADISELITARHNEVTEAVTAAGGAVQKMARRAPKPIPSPEGTTSGTGLLVASNAPGVTPAGTPITDRVELGRMMGEAVVRLQNLSGSHKVVIASAAANYPEERKLGASAEENTRKMEALCGPHAPRYDRETHALVATGGICAPVNVSYAVPVWATAATPIADGLQSFEATRGGIVFTVPPDIAEWEAATGIWTEATDAEPAGATKPVKVLACGAEEKVFVEAISTRIGFGNLQARFAPEQVAANTDLAITAAARVREENLLNKIEAICVKKLETAAHLGAARDLFSNIAFAVAAYRDIHRIPDSQTFTVLLPAIAKELIRADLAREQAHDNASSFNVWAVTDQMIDALFTTYHIDVIWHLDGQKEPASKNYESQRAIAANVAEGKKIDEIFPQKAWETKGLVWYLFPEGAIQRLDGGRLDLGVVRDATLDATNDFETFVEVFEGIANRSFSKGVWQILSSLKATGGSAATVTAVAP